MKKCPYCAEEIQDAAIKCRHCGEFLEAPPRRLREEERVKWYCRKSFIILAVCCVGPLALPLIWLRPATPRGWKIGLTLVILLLSGILCMLAVESIRSIIEYYSLITDA